MKINRIAIIEDDENLRYYLTQQIQNNIDIDEIITFGDAETALLELSINPAKIALFDINLPKMNGIECIAQLKKVQPNMLMIVLTVYDNAENIFNAIKAGAVGYLLKNTPPQKIIEAIEEVNNGGSPMSGQIARKVITAFAEKEKPNAHFEVLSKREQSILEELKQGFMYKEIASKLNISFETVRTHVRNIYAKLQVNSNIEAINKVYK